MSETAQIISNIGISILILLQITVSVCNLFHSYRLERNQKNIINTLTNNTTPDTENVDAPNNTDSFGDTHLVSAKEAWESTKKPELYRTTNAINEARKQGDKYIYMSSKTPHEETLITLLAVGYDIHANYFKHSQEFSVTVSFNKTATGNLTFEDALTKQKFQEEISDTMGRKDNFDITGRQDW